MKINKEKVKKIITSINENENFIKALTHISFCNENDLPPEKSYENLEFLGDSILNFQTCYFIYHNFPYFNEGKMSKLKQLMIQEKTLADISREIDLAKNIRLGAGEKKNNGLQRDSIWADVFESFLAALYLTKGEKETRRFLKMTLFSWVKGKENLIWDYKTQLQEYCQAVKNEVSYKLISSKWKKNEVLFTVIAEDKLKTFSVQGSGKNRKSAEQNAAEKALQQIEKKNSKEQMNL